MRNPWRPIYHARSSRRSRRWPGLLAASLLAIALWQLSGAALIHVKARLAPLLIERAWARSMAMGAQIKPWPWADTWPVAQLSVPELGITRYVLAGTHGASLPFGPGHLDGTAAPGQPGTTVIAAHRDTHFSFLPQLKSGMRVQLTDREGQQQSYRVHSQKIVDARLSGITLPHDGNELLLVTCEPTDVLRYRGPFRLVVSAVAGP